MLQMLAKDVCSILFEDGLGEIIIVGNCPITRTGRAFKISIVCDVHAGVQATASELFNGPHKEFFGSGARRARGPPDWSHTFPLKEWTLHGDALPMARRVEIDPRPRLGVRATL